MIPTVPNVEAQETGNSQRRERMVGCVPQKHLAKPGSVCFLYFSDAQPSGIRLEYEMFELVNILIIFSILLAHLEKLILPRIYKVF